MKIVTVKACDLWVGDIIGEGQRLWYTNWHFDTGVVVVYWGDGEQVQDEAHRLAFKKDDLVKVLREEPWLTALLPQTVSVA